MHGKKEFIYILPWYLFRTVLAIASLLAIGGCETILSSAARTRRDWHFVQSVGGLALGSPQRDRRGHVLLPIRCNVSGTQAITVRPTVIDSAQVCEAPIVRISSSTVLLTIRTTLPSSAHFSAHCPAADLGSIPAGTYSVVYLSPDRTRHSLGSIWIP